MRRQDPNALRDALTAFVSELRIVREAFVAPDVASTCTDPHRHNREWCVVYLNDAWHRFCRRLIMASAVLEPMTLTGTLVARAGGLRTEEDVLARLRRMPGPPRPRYWEPRWHDAVDASRAARFLSVGNAAQIIAALASTPSPAPDLNTVRNFIAHRNQSTASKFRAVLVRYAISPPPGTSSRAIVDDLVSKRAASAAVFLEWCSQIERIAVASVS